jgi:hypothetical protein
MNPILYIEENQKVRLPKKYHKTNNICAIIYDQITEIFTEDIYKELCQSELKKTENENFEEYLKENKTHILDWLKTNQRNDELEIILTKHIALSVISDFINFIFESLYCAQRGKMTVAYALLRKPFTDELLILEQLLTNKKDFINRFFHDGNPENYDPSSRDVNKTEIINKACEKLTLNLFFPSDLIFDMRYNKSYDAGINGSSNQALHIVTKDKNYKTAEQNLNFVFSNKEDHQTYLENYYFIVPHLLFYAVSIIDQIIFELIDNENAKSHKIIKEFQRLVGFILFTESSELYSKNKTKKILDIIGNTLEFKCKNCNNINIMEKADLELFFKTEILICTKCFNNLISNENVSQMKNILKK